MAAIALGSDGGGSIRYPAGLTGLVGLKPHRDLLPVGPEHASGWHGLLALGPLTRSVRDAALFVDVVCVEREANGLRDALTESSPRLRIAVSTNPPPGTHVTLSPAGPRAVDVQHRDRLEARTRSVARLARLLPPRSLRKALAHEAQIAATINTAFDSADVVLTPVCPSPAPRLDECPTRGALRSLRASNTSAWLVPWNVTGQPAMAVPVGIDDDNLPTAIQLAGKPHDEAALLRLASEIEAAHPFPRWSLSAMRTSGK
jgi:amidase